MSGPGSLRFAWGMLALGALALLAALAGGALGYSTPGGQGNVTLASIDAATAAVEKVSDSPLAFRVNETLVVSGGDTLVVAPGTEVVFAPGTQLVIYGGLAAQGTAGAPVVLRVEWPANGTPVDWMGLLAESPSAFFLEHASLNATIDVAVLNAAGPVIRSVSYEGRLLLSNVTGAVVEDLVMRPGPVDVGRPPLWVEASAGVRVARGDFLGATGSWSREGVTVANSSDITVVDCMVRTDNPNIVGVNVLQSTRVRLENFTFTTGPNGVPPNQALQVTRSEGLWVEGLTITHPAGMGAGAIYGEGSNATIANSTFPVGLTEGAWGPGGSLTGANATRLPVRPVGGAAVVEYELVQVLALFTSGNPVSSGSATVANASYAASGAVSQGSTGWLWLLRSWTNGTQTDTSSRYTASVSCNCTGASVAFDIADAPGFAVTVRVGDSAPPVLVVAPVAPASTGAALVLSAAGSFDNDAVEALTWRAAGVNATGLPCAQAACSVTFHEPGNFSVVVEALDPSGNLASLTLRLAVRDATPPVVQVTAVVPERPGQNESFEVRAGASDNDPAFLPAVEWFVDGERVAGDTLTQTLRVAAIGEHLVEVVVRDDAGNAGNASRWVQVRDATPPVIGPWAAPAGLTAPATLELNGSVASDNVAVTSWRWRVEGPGTAYNLTGQRPSATLPAAGAYSVTLSASDAEGNTATWTFVVEVAAPPAPPGFLPAPGALAAAAAILAGAFLAAWRRR